MIRKLQKEDIEQVAKIWFHTNICAHHFIPEKYWEDHFQMVKEMFPEAEIYVYEDGNDIQGFVGLSGDYIEGIFVRQDIQSKGIGKRLLDYVKSIKKRLSLSVYQKNVRAVKFYEREDFVIQSENVDDGTGEKEYLMSWGDLLAE